MAKVSDNMIERTFYLNKIIKGNIDEKQIF